MKDKGGRSCAPTTAPLQTGACQHCFLLAVRPSRQCQNQFAVRMRADPCFQRRREVCLSPPHGQSPRLSLVLFGCRDLNPDYSVPKSSHLKYGFRASGVRTTASASRAETGLLPRFLSSVLKRPSQEVRRELASGERFSAVSASGPVNRSALKTPGNLTLSAASGLAESATRMGTGGEGGIRTHGTLARTPVFETGAIDHSATSPSAQVGLPPMGRAWRRLIARMGAGTQGPRGCGLENPAPAAAQPTAPWCVAAGSDLRPPAAQPVGNPRAMPSHPQRGPFFRGSVPPAQ